MLYYHCTKSDPSDKDEKAEPPKKTWRHYVSLSGGYLAYAVGGALIFATLPVWIFYSIYVNWGKDAIYTLKAWKRNGWKRPSEAKPFCEPKPKVMKIRQGFRP